jgi:hypothetical protein
MGALCGAICRVLAQEFAKSASVRSAIGRAIAGIRLGITWLLTWSLAKLNEPRLRAIQERLVVRVTGPTASVPMITGILRDGQLTQLGLTIHCPGREPFRLQ